MSGRPAVPLYGTGITGVGAGVEGARLGREERYSALACAQVIEALHFL